MRIVYVRIINHCLPDAWYRHLVGRVIKVADRGDYEVIDPEITNDKAGEYNNTGLICKDDALIVNQSTL